MRPLYLTHIRFRLASPELLPTPATPGFSPRLSHCVGSSVDFQEHLVVVLNKFDGELVQSILHIRKNVKILTAGCAAAN